ncbi:IclR family protein transcriptional regulator [Paeniglutamicibacter gangotriensis Lz1y]|uniref:IclR family protein transcriptional regulator n=2 Tax=Paeniglutamicibacter gangotriensis TaxID=254787 RepID=M7NP23_9MICC|nr:IclR family protein transcriptional regulator [Paeniglutamicibacter gangotriensis Lz1y]
MTVAASAPTGCSPAAVKSQAPSMAARMTLIMEAFEPFNAKFLLDEITERTKLPRSTTHRILDQLVQFGWVEHTPEGYGMGWRTMKYRSHDSVNGRIRAESAPLLHELQMRTGMVVHLAVLDGLNIHYLDKLGGRAAVSVPSRVGGSNSAHGTALGKSMLAWMDPEDLDELYKDGLPQTTQNTIKDPQMLYAELSRIRRRGGLAYESGESFDGVACVAASIRDRHEPLASISLVGRTQDPLERMAPLVLDAARRVSEALLIRA